MSKVLIATALGLAFAVIAPAMAIAQGQEPDARIPGVSAGALEFGRDGSG